MRTFFILCCLAFASGQANHFPLSPGPQGYSYQTPVLQTNYLPPGALADGALGGSTLGAALGGGSFNGGAHSGGALGGSAFSGGSFSGGAQSSGALGANAFVGALGGGSSSGGALSGGALGGSAFGGALGGSSFTGTSQSIGALGGSSFTGTSQSIGGLGGSSFTGTSQSIGGLGGSAFGGSSQSIGGLGDGTFGGGSFSGAVQSSTGPQGGYSSGNTNVRTEYTKEFFTYHVDDKEYININQGSQNSGTVKKKIRVVIIKGPEISGLEEAVVAVNKNVNEEKLAIYVLSKQADIEALTQKLSSSDILINHKPEVHFVKYKTEADAEKAKEAIHKQYESLDGPSSSQDGGAVPVHTYASKSAEQAPAPAAPTTITPGYLPSSVV